MAVEEILKKFVVCEDLDEIWTELTVYLSELGFDRVIFGHRDNLSETNFQNLDNLVFFSTYGDTLNQALMQKRMYMSSPTVKWALQNEGWISWGEIAKQLDQKSLSPQEEQVVNFTRNLGLTAGFTFSVPFRQDARFRSVFGMATPVGEPQETADRIIKENKNLIEQMLLSFVLAVNKFQKVEPGQRLTASQIRTLSLLAEGRTLSEIAELEGVHIRTIDKRLTESRRKFAASNSLQAVVLAERGGQLIIVRE